MNPPSVNRVEVFKNRVRGGRGTLVVDNRASGGKLEEHDTLTCCHCNRIVVLNPERKRERNWCRKCNAYVCDAPLCVAECNPILQGVELALKYPDLNVPFLGRSKDGGILFDPRLRDRERLY